MIGDIVDSGVHRGIEWRVRVAPFGLNGYVKLPIVAPFTEPSFDLDSAVNVHGGITGSYKDGWTGFDTAHSGDAWSQEDADKYGFNNGSSWRSRFREWLAWTPERVVEETCRLADQVADMRDRPAPFELACTHDSCRVVTFLAWGNDAHCPGCEL